MTVSHALPPLETVPRSAAADPQRGVVSALRAAARDGAPAALALVVETDGSTYVGAGAMALFAADGAQAGWLSGGCLEPEIARRAHAAAASGRLDWMEVDTRDDEDLLSGSALGCRGRLRIVLLPLSALRGIDAACDAWFTGGDALSVQVSASGDVAIGCGDARVSIRIAGDAPEWAPADARWTTTLAPMPTVLVCGAGPETATLLPLLGAMGWRTTVAERRERWFADAALADAHVRRSPADVLASNAFDAALVMHHNFEADRDALSALAAHATPFVGLLGPARRRDDLFKLLTPAEIAALRPRLHAPIGLPLGGRGPEAIALCIAAQLQAVRHGRAS